MPDVGAPVVADGWQRARLLEVIEEAPDAVTLRLELAVTRGFLPGQYYKVSFEVPGRPRPVQRAYSVGSSPLPDPGVIDLGVKEVGGGFVSPRLVRGLEPGTYLDVKGPYGRFTWAGEGPGPVLLVGGGSGVVPLMSMVRYAAEARLEISLVMLCSATTFEHALYREELAGLEASQPSLRVVHTVTRDPGEPRAAYHRRVDEEMLAEVVGQDLPARAYLCGPPGMVEATVGWLAGLGMGRGDIFTEKYGAKYADACGSLVPEEPV